MHRQHHRHYRAGSNSYPRMSRLAGISIGAGPAVGDYEANDALDHHRVPVQEHSDEHDLYGSWGMSRSRGDAGQRRGSGDAKKMAGVCPRGSPEAARPSRRSAFIPRR
jgi:hypothetical protein